ncbi:XdhC family protein, partial [Xanthomonas sp. Kuri4-1]
MSAARHSIEASLRACRPGEASTLALVMATEGSTYSQPGAMAWFGPDAAQVGWLSGGCLEDEIAGHAAEAARSGRVGWLEVDTRDDESLLSGSAVGCRGRLCLALLPVS